MHGPRMRIVATVILVGIPSAVAFQPLPPNIEGALQRNAARLSPITIRTHERFQSTHGAEELATLLTIDPLIANQMLVSTDRELVWDNGRFYFSRSAFQKGTWQTFEYAFDGRVFYSGNPTARLADGTIRPTLARHLPERLNRDSSYLEAGYFEAAGFEFPTRAGQVLAHDPIRSRILTLLEGGGSLQRVSSVQLDGRTVVLVDVVGPNAQSVRARAKDMGEVERSLRDNPAATEESVQQALESLRMRRELPDTLVERFYLDPEMGFALVRHEQQYPDGTAVHSTNNEVFEEVDGRGIWLPRKSVTAYSVYPSAPGRVLQAHALDMVIEVEGQFGTMPVEPTRFVVHYGTPGSLIVDNTVFDKAKIFEMTARPADLDKTVAGVSESHKEARRERETKGSVMTADVDSQNLSSRVTQRDARSPKLHWLRSLAHNAWLGGILLVACAIGGMFWWRRFRG